MTIRVYGQAKSQIIWHDASNFQIEGKGWKETKHTFDRLPSKAETKVSSEVWGPSQHSTELAVRFTSNSNDIHVRWKLTSPVLQLLRMPASSVSGLDLYTKHQGQWIWLGNAVASSFPENESQIISDVGNDVREYRLYLPLYNGIESLQIGVNQNSELNNQKISKFGLEKPILFYGTSIVSGEVVSRPGMTYPAILGRRLATPAINLGFSGFCHMESEVINLLLEINAAALVVDCLPTMLLTEVRARTIELVQQVRLKNPSMPIILLAHFLKQHGKVVKTVRDENEAFNTQLQIAYDQLIQGGTLGLTLVNAVDLLDVDDEGTVDGLHLSDLGAMRFAEKLTPILRNAIKVLR